MEEALNINKLLHLNYDNAMDVRGTPTTVCPCGCDIWRLLVKWDEEDNTIAMYFLDMECGKCGTLATAPAPEGESYDTI